MRPNKKQVENTGTVKFCDRFDELDYPTSILNLYNNFHNTMLMDVDLTNRPLTLSTKFKFVIKDGQIIEVID